MPDLDVVICGAGIGGLAAAAALRRQGIATTILEQAPELGEVGAGLQIGPNATRVLYLLGLREAMDEVSLEVQETVNRRWNDGSIIAKTTLGASATARYGAPYLQVHRADLHQALLSAAVGPGFPGPPAVVRTASTAVDIDESDPLRPTVILADGTHVPADVIVGADGIRSMVRAHIGAPVDVLDSGDMAFRTLVDGEAVRRDPATRFLVDWQAGNVWFGPHGHLVVYPVRRARLVNVVGIGPITEELSRDWRRPAGHDELMAAYQGWDERVLALMSKATGPISLWAMKHQEPFSCWNRGNITLLGDASHSMVPYVSQGASQAIEDAAVLAEELADVDPIGAGAALAGYVERRAERARTVQLAAIANRGVFHLPDGDRQRERDQRMRAEARNVDTRLDWIYQGTPLRGLATAAS
ncbi:FAD-dependent monooxygenase [Mycolicibacterium palauense]|uniref:FAD-dependent monooxygenase n=1 Tax=Mycolicibacterium palauense TaxID=2034511 RepID=UPI000BFF0BE1|nr:FAD-dependent monooxygenase [Mycolicibacterium palauense]